MTARDDLVENFIAHACLSQPAAKLLTDAALERHAHELAEQIRAEVKALVGGHKDFVRGYKRGLACAADLIDPEVNT